MPQRGGAYIERHRNRFRVRWAKDGRRVRRSFDSEAEARDFLQRLHTQDRRGAAASSQRIEGALTVMEVVQNWYQGHRRNLSPGTQRDYEGRIRRDVGRIGALDADELARNPRQLRAFYATLTPTNARRLQAILRQAFRDAVDTGSFCETRATS